MSLDQSSIEQRLPADQAAPRVVLFCLSAREQYRPKILSDHEVFCGPDCETVADGNGYRTIRTPAGQFDASAILAQLPPEQQPDLIVVKADATRRIFPRNLAASGARKVLVLGNTQHMRAPVRAMLDYAASEPFDVLVSDHKRHHLHFFHEAGHRSVHWLPGLFFQLLERDIAAPPEIPVSFVGQVGRFHPYRAQVLRTLRDAGLPLQIQRAPLHEAAGVYARSQITLNCSLNGDLNLRVFEALGAGGFLLTDRLAPEAGLDTLFEAGRHLDFYGSAGELIEKIRHYLDHPEEAERIRRAGREEVVANHHPDLKIRQFLDLVFDGKVDPRYDMAREPRCTVPVAVDRAGFDQRVAAYEALQEIHLNTEAVSVFADAPAHRDLLSDARDLPRLAVASHEAAQGETGTLIPAGPDSAAAQHVLLLDADDSQSLSKLAGFVGANVVLVGADAAVKARVAELRGWGFEQPDELVPLLVCRAPLTFAAMSFKAGATEAGRRKLESLIKAPLTAEECVTAAQLAHAQGLRSLVEPFFARAVSLDRGAPLALANLALQIARRGEKGAAYALTGEAARAGALPREVQALRAELEAAVAGDPTAAAYRRLVGGSGRYRRVLVIDADFTPPGDGVGNAAIDVAWALRGRGHAVSVLARPVVAGDVDDRESAMGDAVQRRLEPAVDDSAAERNRIRVAAAIDLFKPELCLLGAVAGLGTGAVREVLGSGVPVLHLMNSAVPPFPADLVADNRLYSLVAPSRWVVEELARKEFAVPDSVVVMPPADLRRCYRHVLPDADSARILYVGPLTAEHGAVALVESLAAIYGSGAVPSATFAGDAPDPQMLARLRDRVARMGLTTRVRFLPMPDRAGLVRLLDRHNMLVRPTTVPVASDPVVFDAMAAGLPVVVSSVGGAAEMVRDGVDGVLVAAGNLAALSNALTALARNPARLAAMAAGARDRAVAHSPESVTDRFEDLIQTRLEQARYKPTSAERQKLLQKHMQGVALKRRKDLVRLGTPYGGWIVPTQAFNESSICYCFGAGEDISFDVELINKFGCNVYTFDPTPRAIAHVRTLIDKARQGERFEINNKPGEYYELASEQASKLHFSGVGAWSSDTVMRFFAPSNANYVSHPILNLQNTKDYFEARCLSLKSIMAVLGHDAVDLVKMDIEGAEYEVLESMLATGIRPKVLCIEFDEAGAPRDAGFARRLRACIDSWLALGYTVASVEDRNFTLVSDTVPSL